MLCVSLQPARLQAGCYLGSVWPALRLAAITHPRFLFYLFIALVVFTVSLFMASPSKCKEDVSVDCRSYRRFVVRFLINFQFLGSCSVLLSFLSGKLWNLYWDLFMTLVISLLSVLFQEFESITLVIVNLLFLKAIYYEISSL